MILALCDNPDILRIFKFIKTAINIIRILVPLLLIISLMYGYLRPMLSDKKDAFTKETTTALKKIIAAILVFFIPTLINLLLDMAGTNNLGITNCFSNATTANITQAYIRNARRYVEIANSTIDRSDYNKAVGEVSNARSQIYKMTGSDDNNDIQELEGQLQEIEQRVKDKEEEIKEQRERTREEIRNNPQNYADLTDGPDRFYEAYLGTSHSNQFGVQCVQGFVEWLDAYNVPHGSSGNCCADGYWLYRDSMHNFSQYFDYIYDSSQFRNGDWVFWAQGSSSHPYSHVAMYYNGKEFGQNQRQCSSTGSFCLGSTDFSDALGALRCELANKYELYDKSQYDFLWVTEFPMFEWSEEEQRLVAMHHPFTSPMVEDFALLDTDPINARSNAYDMVINGQEAGGGSIRIHNPELQKKIFNLIGLTQEQIKTKFGFFVDAFKYGAPPHGGLAFGLDRMVMLVSQIDNIKDVIAFPKVQNASCLMSDAPSEVDPQQLLDLKIECSQEK